MSLFSFNNSKAVRPNSLHLHLLKKKKKHKTKKAAEKQEIEFQLQSEGIARQESILSQFDDFQQTFTVQQEMVAEEDDLFLIPSPDARNLQLTEEKNQFLQAEAQRKSLNPAGIYPIVAYKQQILQLIDKKGLF